VRDHLKGLGELNQQLQEHLAAANKLVGELRAEGSARIGALEREKNTLDQHNRALSAERNDLLSQKLALDTQVVEITAERDQWRATAEDRDRGSEHNAEQLTSVRADLEALQRENAYLKAENSSLKALRPSTAPPAPPAATGPGGQELAGGNHNGGQVPPPPPPPSDKSSSSASSSSGLDIPGILSKPEDIATLVQRLVNRELRKTASTPAAPAPAKGPKAPSPDTWDGSVDKLRKFFASCETVFTLQAHNFQDEWFKLVYAAGYFKGVPLQWWQTVRTGYASLRPTWEQFKEQVMDLVGYDTQRYAYLRKMASCVHGTSIVAYLTQMQLLNDVVGYDEKAFKDALEKNLQTRILKAIAATPVANEPFNDWLHRVRTIGLSMEETDKKAEHKMGEKKPEKRTGRSDGKKPETKKDGTPRPTKGNTRVHKQDYTEAERAAYRKKRAELGTTVQEQIWAKKNRCCPRCLRRGHSVMKCDAKAKEKVNISSVDRKRKAENDGSGPSNKKHQKEVAGVVQITELSSDEEGFGPEV
jgi:hypothetical protein